MAPRENREQYIGAIEEMHSFVVKYKQELFSYDYPVFTKLGIWFAQYNNVLGYFGAFLLGRVMAMRRWVQERIR